MGGVCSSCGKGSSSSVQTMAPSEHAKDEVHHQNEPAKRADDDDEARLGFKKKSSQSMDDMRAAKDPLYTPLYTRNRQNQLDQQKVKHRRATDSPQFTRLPHNAFDPQQPPTRQRSDKDGEASLLPNTIQGVERTSSQDQPTAVVNSDNGSWRKPQQNDKGWSLSGKDQSMDRGHRKSTDSVSSMYEISSYFHQRAPSVFVMDDDDDDDDGDDNGGDSSSSHASSSSSSESSSDNSDSDSDSETGSDSDSDKQAEGANNKNKDNRLAVKPQKLGEVSPMGTLDMPSNPGGMDSLNLGEAAVAQAQNDKKELKKQQHKKHSKKKKKKRKKRRKSRHRGKKIKPIRLGQGTVSAGASPNRSRVRAAPRRIISKRASDEQSCSRAESDSSAASSSSSSSSSASSSSSSSSSSSEEEEEVQTRDGEQTMKNTDHKKKKKKKHHKKHHKHRHKTHKHRHKKKKHKKTKTNSTKVKVPTRTTKPDEKPKFRWKLAANNLLGAGAYGRVHLALDLDTGQLMAVKQVSVQREVMKDSANPHLQALHNEVDLLRDVSHENIVTYLGIEECPTGLNIFMEYVPGGSIAELIKQFGSLDESLVRKFTRQILQGLAYLHNKKIAHRDIKGGNILIDVTGRCKISDFGTSSRIADLAGEKDLTGTPYWMAPEVIRQEGHGFKVDIWSLGCTIIEMTTGLPPWHQMKNPARVLYHIGSTNDPPDMPDNVSETGLDFIRQCFTRDPKKRPSAHRLLRHEWLQGEEAEMPTVETTELYDDDSEEGSDFEDGEDTGSVPQSPALKPTSTQSLESLDEQEAEPSHPIIHKPHSNSAPTAHLITIPAPDDAGNLKQTPAKVVKVPLRPLPPPPPPPPNFAEMSGAQPRRMVPGKLEPITGSPNNSSAGAMSAKSVSPRVRKGKILPPITKGLKTDLSKDHSPRSPLSHNSPVSSVSRAPSIIIQGNSARLVSHYRESMSSSTRSRTAHGNRTGSLQDLMLGKMASKSSLFSSESRQASSRVSTKTASVVSSANKTTSNSDKPKGSANSSRASIAPRRSVTLTASQLLKPRISVYDVCAHLMKRQSRLLSNININDADIRQTIEQNDACNNDEEDTKDNQLPLSRRVTFHSSIGFGGTKIKHHSSEEEKMGPLHINPRYDLDDKNNHARSRSEEKGGYVNKNRESHFQSTPPKHNHIPSYARVTQKKPVKQGMSPIVVSSPSSSEHTGT